MKLSLNWISDYVTLPQDLSIAQLAYDLTMSTVEVEGVIELARQFDNMVVGAVNDILPHPNADKLRLCQTDLGNGEIHEIVCGGSNVKKGMKAAVARPGAKVRWHGEGNLIELGVAKVRGVESYGMICSSSEIGLFDLFPYTEEATIIDLSDFAVPAGTPLAEALGLNDVILEIDNKSLTNRPDLWGHYGIAREIAALYGLPLKDFAPYTPSSTPDLEITIADSERCPRYIGVKIEGLAIKPAPFDIQSRIWRVGMRPINAVVDITNFVMLATGQPTHAFDSDHIKGHITVRRAADGEKLLLLDGKELSLCTENLVIADDVNPVALAGVMGGEKDSILPDTTKVILEIANFEPISTRRTAAQFEVRTEAATRYEKGIDPERSDIALSLAMQLFAEFYPNMSVTGFCDNYPNRLQRNEIDVSLDWLAKRLGKRISDSDIAERLERLGFDVNIDGDIMHVTAPTWRSTGDVSIPDDIMEEVARMYGFENFEPLPITTSFEGAINQIDIDIDRKIREYLAFRCGMREIFSYPWVGDEFVNALFPDHDGMLTLSTPPSPNERYIRTSLLPNLCKAVEGNQRSFDEFAVFESAQVFFDKDFSAQYDVRESLPLQRKNVAGACVAPPEKVNTLFRQMKGIVESLPRFVHIEPLTFAQNEKPHWADATVWLNIIHDGKRIGNLALLSKKSSLDCGIKHSAVMLFELDIDVLKPYPSRSNRFVSLPEYPVTDYDVSMLFDVAVKWEAILESVTGSDASGLLRSVSFVDEYRGRQIPDGKKSMSFRMVIGSLEKTLTSAEIEGCADTVRKRLQKSFGAELR